MNDLNTNSAKRTVIAVVGLIGAGKDEAADYLSQKLGWPVVQTSKFLKDELKNRGLEINRDNLAMIGDEFCKKFGDHFLAAEILKNNSGDLIVSGPRQLGQIDYYKENSRLILIAITAPDELRFERVRMRGGTKEAENLQEFIESERKNDLSGRANKTDECIKLADYQVENTGTINDLDRKLDEILINKKLIINRDK